MQYLFRCPLCKKESERSIKIEDYDTQKNEQLCYECGVKMKRVLEVPSFFALCKGMCGTDSGGWNN